MNKLNWAIVIAAAACCLPLAQQAAAKVVGDGKLEQYCAEEAMTRLNVDRDAILTLPTELSKGHYFVSGQTPTEGTDVTTFECQFDGKKAFKSFKVLGKPAAAAPAASTMGAPPAALEACIARLGTPATVKQVSQLKPGYHEIILQAKKGKRKVACTATDDGSAIEEWVEVKW